MFSGQGFFESFFRPGHQSPFAVQGQGVQFDVQGPSIQAHYGPSRESQQPPPASKKFIDSLHPKPVTEDDVQEVNNKECLICLEDHTIGSMACKLPCGHLFHKSCVSEWLVKHCTCPACRYEVECSDPHYEKERKGRMQKTRKIRYRLDEFQAMKISEIRQVAAQIGVDISGCIDKRDIIDKLVDSGKVDVTEGIPVVEIPENSWNELGVKGLRDMLKGYGISDKDAIMKSELRTLLLNSGRIRVIPDTSSAHATVESAATQPSTTLPTFSDSTQEISASLPTSASSPPLSATPSTTSGDARFQLGKTLLATMSVREIKSIMQAYNISSSDCLERQDLLDRMAQDGRIILSED